MSTTTISITNTPAVHWMWDGSTWTSVSPMLMGDTNIVTLQFVTTISTAVVPGEWTITCDMPGGLLLVGNDRLYFSVYQGKGNITTEGSPSAWQAEEFRIGHRKAILLGAGGQVFISSATDQLFDNTIKGAERIKPGTQVINTHPMWIAAGDNDWGGNTASAGLITLLMWTENTGTAGQELRNVTLDLTYSTSTDTYSKHFTGLEGPVNAMGRADECPICGRKTTRDTWVFSPWHERMTCPECSDPEDSYENRQGITSEDRLGVGEDG